MDTLNQVLELLNSITDETTIEEARRVLLDVAEMCKNVIDDISAMKNLVDELTTSNTDKDYEIARLKEENGRIYRDRAEQIMAHAEAEAEKIAEVSTEDAEAELIANIDI